MAKILLARIKSAPPPVARLRLVGTLAQAAPGVVYESRLSIVGGGSILTAAVRTGTRLPIGLSVSIDYGTRELVVSGTALESGAVYTELQVSDEYGQRAVRAVSWLLQAPPLAITGTLADAERGVAYSSGLAVSGGVPPYTWSVTGSLPAGLTLNTSTGVISGTPTESGTFSIIVTVTDAVSDTASSPQSLFVDPGAEQLVDIVTYTGDGTADRLIPSLDLSDGGAVLLLGSGAVNNGYFLLSDGTSFSTRDFRISGSANHMQPSSGGFVVGVGGTSGVTNTNNAGSSYVAYVFKRAPETCDVVFYTGNGTGQNIPIDVVAPGAIIVYRTSATAGGVVWHRENANTQTLNTSVTNAAATSATAWDSTTPSGSSFRVGANTTTNGNGNAYVAVVFAHDTGPDGCVRCDTYTGNASTVNDVTASVWSPDIIINKASSGASNWEFVDQGRTPAFSGNESVARSGATSFLSWGNKNVVSLDSATGYRVVTNTDGAWNSNLVKYINIVARKARS